MSEHHRLTALEGWHIYMIKLLDSGLRPPFEQLLREHGFSTAQYTALTVLARRPGITSSELARRTFVRAQSMADTVKVLMDKGLVRREPDQDHARRLLLFPTDGGYRALQECQGDVNQLETRLLENLDDDERRTVSAALRTMRFNLQRINDDTP
ncbi:MarR family winged helix-turn-helix transcriptional regulator [Citricoccus sp. NR2]|uniref:MarR family winged helix-turn-helix transcriptional regulator n=1 Tax=Citricoccus sp. NR2 TaxID=3004095 RepID=UPI0022DD1034|nr:MarR family transcriptional regulator [Citricoccus sp. NR2]WBL20246.1 MarR family transcriptional regulator [Citricoccus sp. NR2]